MGQDEAVEVSRVRCVVARERNVEFASPEQFVPTAFAIDGELMRCALQQSWFALAHAVPDQRIRN